MMIMMTMIRDSSVTKDNSVLQVGESSELVECSSRHEERECLRGDRLGKGFPRRKKVAWVRAVASLLIT